MWGQSRFLSYIKMKHKNNSNFKAPIVILVRPQLGQNMGMVARAMMNCGLSELRLVFPRENHLSKEALSASSGAQIILEQAKVYPSIEKAVSDLHYIFATTARVRGIKKTVYSPEEGMNISFEKISANQKVGILFGPERTGLENDDIILANSLITIPLNPIHSSLNLAQAVLLIGWTWWQKNLNKVPKISQNTLPANKNELDVFLNFIIELLENKGYFRIKNKEKSMKNNLKNIFTKSDLSSSEIKTLYRVIKYLSASSNK